MNEDDTRKILVCAAEKKLEINACALATSLGAEYIPVYRHPGENCLLLSVGPDGLTMEGQGMTIKGDLTEMLPRIKKANLKQELLVKASGINRAGKKQEDKELLAIDATAGMGEDSLLLAAAGYTVIMYEKDPVIAALLKDSLERASLVPELHQVTDRMKLVTGDSISALEQMKDSPDLVFLDPMFPERKKSGLVKKKFQLLHHLEKPCENEGALLRAAICTVPGRIVIKRPLKGPYLCGIRPDFSLQGKAVRYDCLLPPFTGDKYL